MTGPRWPSDRLLEMAAAARVKRRTRGAARIAVLGEFNSGKTTLVNAMLGADVFPAGFATRTELPTITRFAARPSFSITLGDGRRVPLAVEDLGRPLPAGARQVQSKLPLECLRHTTIVDAPALGVQGEAADRRTVEACRGADLVVWCTPAMQAWKHSEQLLWHALPAGLRKRGVLAVTFADLVTPESDLDRLLARLRADAGSHFADVIILAARPRRTEEPTRLPALASDQKASRHSHS